MTRTARVRIAALGALLLAGAGCAPKAEDLVPGGGSTDSTGAQAAVTDSARRDSARARGDSLPSVTTSSKAVRGDSIIGRDSAFGPMFAIDSTGKQVPIRRP